MVDHKWLSPLIFTKNIYIKDKLKKLIQASNICKGCLKKTNKQTISLYLSFIFAYNGTYKRLRSQIIKGSLKFE